VEFKGHLIQGISTYYAQARRGEPLALIGSADFLEIALREGSAEKVLGLKRGSSLILKKGR
jgi:S-adenosylmethionine hydrolase